MDKLPNELEIRRGKSKILIKFIRNLSSRVPKFHAAGDEMIISSAVPTSTSAGTVTPVGTVTAAVLLVTAASLVTPITIIVAERVTGTAVTVTGITRIGTMN